MTNKIGHHLQSGVKFLSREMTEIFWAGLSKECVKVACLPRVLSRICALSVFSALLAVFFSAMYAFRTAAMMVLASSILNNTRARALTVC